MLIEICTVGGAGGAARGLGGRRACVRRRSSRGEAVGLGRRGSGSAVARARENTNDPGDQGTTREQDMPVASHPGCIRICSQAQELCSRFAAHACAVRRCSSSLRSRPARTPHGATDADTHAADAVGPGRRCGARARRRDEHSPRIDHADRDLDSDGRTEIIVVDRATCARVGDGNCYWNVFRQPHTWRVRAVHRHVRRRARSRRSPTRATTT